MKNKKILYFRHPILENIYIRCKILIYFSSYSTPNRIFLWSGKNLWLINSCLILTVVISILFSIIFCLIIIIIIYFYSGENFNGTELPTIYGDVCVLDSKNRSLGKRRIEAQTAKRSLFVIISFLAFTLPYPLLVIIEKAYKQARYKHWHELQYFLNVMSLLSSALNPLIYGLANRQFRNAFMKIYHRYHRRYILRDYL